MKENNCPFNISVKDEHAELLQPEQYSNLQGDYLKNNRDQRQNASFVPCITCADADHERGDNLDFKIQTF